MEGETTLNGKFKKNQVGVLNWLNLTSWELPAFKEYAICCFPNFWNGGSLLSPAQHGKKWVSLGFRSRGLIWLTDLELCLAVWLP